MNEILTIFFDIFKSIWFNIDAFIAPIINFIGEFVQSFIPILIDLFGYVIETLKTLMSTLMAFIESTRPFFDSVIQFFNSIIDFFKNLPFIGG